MLANARAGKQNFLRRLRGALEGAGWQVEYAGNGDAARLKAPQKRGYALWHMEPPSHERALCFRRCYVGAFWRIEAVAERWNWPVAQEPFTGAGVPAEVARGFVARWRNQLFPEGAGTGGGIFVPLQGRLTSQRSFQSMSPLAMLEALLEAFPAERLVATLHPREIYHDEELAALEALAARAPRLTVQRGGSDRALAACDLVATQNSGMALRGYFLGKPALLFAGIDFHHIAASVPRDGLAPALAQARAMLAGEHAPDFDGYLHWFLQERAINAGRPEAEAQMLAALARHGWPV